MKKTGIDITNCDREPIHIPGSIQSHGFLLAIDKTAGVIYYASENIHRYTGLKAAQILGFSFAMFIKKGNIAVPSSFSSDALFYDEKMNFDTVNPCFVHIGEAPYHLIIHAGSNNMLLVEFERCQQSTETDINRLIGASVQRILEGRTITNITFAAAQQIREMIEYDRVMIYQFHDDGHGEVIAEDKSEEVESFMGLHFPASDIPKQARDLYLVNLVRLIADVHSQTSSLLAYNNNTAETPAPLDLTHSVLRAVSPIHIQYLKNMGVSASFSVSLVMDGKLWGLVACHNHIPKMIDYRAREAARLLGQILSSSLAHHNKDENKDAVLHYRQAADHFARQLQSEENMADVFRQQAALAMPVTSATGVVILFENTLYTAGLTPPEAYIRLLIDWLRSRLSSSLFYTECLYQQYNQALQFPEVASGILACELSKEMGEYIIWCKPEIVKTVQWAGDPNKPVEVSADGGVTLSPRHSFASWTEQVKNTSERWQKAEVAAAQKLRDDVIHAINQKANAMRQLNEKLKEAYAELDTFSFTISHDLKTPITSIRSYAELMLTVFADLNNDAQHMLQRILKSTDKMQLLIKEVLAYSRISRAPLQREDIDMNGLLQDIIIELNSIYSSHPATFETKHIINISGDKTMLMQVFSNIIGNAVKYSQGAEQPLVVINSEAREDGVLYSVSDNGVGIDMQFGNKIFDLFTRLDNAHAYEGSGVGLSIVKRIADKHNATVWYESEPGKGTTFYLLF